MATSPQSKALAKIILVVDDDQAHASACERVLTQAGYEAITAPDGASALRALADWTVDLLLLDVFMPETDGIEVIQELRRRNPQVRIIAMSGGGWSYANADDVLALCTKLGAHAVLEKPFEANRLLETVAAVLRSQ